MSALRIHACRRRAAQPCLVEMAVWLGSFASVEAAVRCIDSDVQVQATFDAALASAETLEDVRIKQDNFLFNTGEFGYFGIRQGTNKTPRAAGAAFRASAPRGMESPRPRCSGG